MMQRPRVRKMLSDLWGNPTRTLLVVASITVGLLALGIIANMYAVMSEDMRAGYSGANPANIQMQGGPFNTDILNHVRSLPGVAAVEGAQLFNLRLEASPEEWIEFSVKAIPDINDSHLNQVVLLDGSWPPADRQIVIEAYKFEETNAAIGSAVTLELPNGQQRQLQVVGKVNDQTLGAFDTGPGFFVAPAQGYVTADTAEWLGQYPPGSFNTLFITVTGDQGDQAQIKSVADRVRADLESDGVQIYRSITRSAYDHPNRVYVDALIGVLILLGLMIVFLSGFLITNTLQALLKQQVRQIGIMKSLGARRNQVILIYLGLIFIFGVIAALISVPLAARIAFARIDALAAEVNFIFRGPRVIPWAIALQAGLAILAPLLSALVPILQGSRISVQEALSGIRQKAPASPGWLAERMAKIRRIPRPLLISIRNTFRQRGRVILTLITLSLGGAIFIAAFNVQVSMTKHVEQVSRYFLGDVNLTLARPYRTARIKEALADVPGIRTMEGWSAAGAELVRADDTAGEAVQILAPPAGSHLVEPVLLEGRWLLPGDRNAIAVNERFQEAYPGLKPGDTITLRINQEDTSWVVVGIFQLVGNSAGFVSYANYEYVSELLHQANQAAIIRVAGENPNMTQAQQEVLGRQIENALNESGINVREMTPGKSLSSMAADGFSILTAFLLFMAVLTAIVGSIGLAGTMSMNILERTREIGIMRAIGATDSILLRLVIVEGMLIGMLSWVLGSLLAFPISKALADAISLAIFGAPSTFGVSLNGFLIWFAAVFVLSVIASVLPARSAARLTIREVLAYE